MPLRAEPGLIHLTPKEITMVRNFLPLASLSLILLAAPAFAADDALTARITAAAEKACPTQVYDGPKHFFYPDSYKAEHETCVRLVTRSVLAKIAAANSGLEQVAQK
jgi:uncharacterized protein (DUF2141 family)